MKIAILIIVILALSGCTTLDKNASTFKVRESAATGASSYLIFARGEGTVGGCEISVSPVNNLPSLKGAINLHYDGDKCDIQYTKPATY